MLHITSNSHRQRSGFGKRVSKVALISVLSPGLGAGAAVTTRKALVVQWRGLCKHGCDGLGQEGGMTCCGISVQEADHSWGQRKCLGENSAGQVAFEVGFKGWLGIHRREKLRVESHRFFQVSESVL